MDKKVAIFIPAFNAASTLPKVIDRIPAKLKESVTEIFVIDNNSPDNTYLVAVGYQSMNGLHNMQVIRNPENLGYGGSQKVAYQRCIDRNYDCVAMLHGDAQYAPELLEPLLDPILTGKADMVFGSRMKGDPRAGGMPLHRFLGNKFLTWVQNKLLKTKLSEFHSGYRVFSVEALKRVPFHKLSSDYHFDTEIIISFIDNDLKIAESPIPTHYGEEENYVNIWHYGMHVLITTGTYFLHKMRWRHSARWEARLNTPSQNQVDPASSS